MFAKKEYRQLEFFEELAKSPKKKFKRFRLPSIGEERIIFKISYEKVVLFSIGLVLVLTLVFSLGVERGKKLGGFKVQQASRDVIEIVQEEESQSQSKSVFAADIQDAQAGSLEEKQTEDSEEKEEFYAIQLIAYKNISPALKEREMIKKMGFDSFILRGKSGYFLVCAGNFDDQSSAKEKLMDLKETYYDCFIKKVRKEDFYDE